MSQHVTRHDAGGVCTLTLDRADKLNALDTTSFEALDVHLSALEQDEGTVGCVVLRGAGKAFCAGADLKALADTTVKPPPTYKPRIIERLALLKQPVIAAVHGVCFTGGLELALACDFIVADAKARFADTHGKWGLVGAWGMSQRLPRRIGLAAAKRMMMTARVVEATEAKDLGLVDLLALEGKLDEVLQSFVAELLANSWFTNFATKRLLNETDGMSLAEGLAHEHYSHPGVAPDHRERIAAFRRRNVSDEQGNDEKPLDPTRAIVDPHQHFWDHGSVPGVAAGAQPFLLPEFLNVVRDSGHNIVQTLYVECGSMYRREGPTDLRPIGETEFANGIAAMGASGRYGDCRVAAGIVATANLRLGAQVAPILEAQIAAGNGRLRGIRFPTAYAETGLFGRAPDPQGKSIVMDPAFRAGVLALQRFGLSLDVWALHTQLPEVADLASACPAITLVLDHLGTPFKLGAYAGRDAEVFEQWRKGILDLARRPNVVIKLGGLGMDLSAPIGTAGVKASSSQLAAEWRPYIETCIAAFGARRCMFESNFPVDNATCSYGALWNAFKLVVASYSEDEKTALFSGTAQHVYRLPACPWT